MVDCYLSKNGLSGAPETWGTAGSKKLQTLLLDGNAFTSLPGGWAFSELANLTMQGNPLGGERALVSRCVVGMHLLVWVRVPHLFLWPGCVFVGWVGG